MRSFNTPRFRQWALAGGGGVIVGVTLRFYNVGEPAFPPASRPAISSAEADRRIASAKARLNTRPEDFNAWVAAAMAYFQKGPGYYVEAMNALDKARSLGATDAHLFFYAGVMYDALGLPDYAANELSKYRRHYPHDYESIVRLANIYFRQKRYEEAQALYQQALREGSGDPTVWFNEAIVNKEKGDYAAALNCLEQARRMAGRLPDGGFYEEGEIYRLKGDTARAFQAYQQELARAPGHLPSLEATEAIIRKKGDLKQARHLRKRIVGLKKQAQEAAASSIPGNPS